MDFDKDLLRIFHTYLHYVSENPDTNDCQNEIAEWWKRFVKIHKFPPDVTSKLEVQTFPSQNDLGVSEKANRDCEIIINSRIKLLKLLAYRHGLPPSVSNHLYSKLDDVHLPLDVKYQIVTTLKYCIAYDENILEHGNKANESKIADGFSIEQMSYHLEHFVARLEGKNNENYIHNHPAQDEPWKSNLDNDFTQAIVSQLVQCVCIKLTPGNWESQKVVLGKAKIYSDLKTQSFLQNKLANLDLNSHNFHRGHLSQGGQMRADIGTDNSRCPIETPIFSTGTAILAGIHQQKVKASRFTLKADAVKTQQEVISVYKENVSEKASMEAVDLTKLLNSKRGKSHYLEQQAEVYEAINDTGKSTVGCFWRLFPGIRVVLLWKRAKDGHTLCEEDIAYATQDLLGNLGQGWMSGPNSFDFKSCCTVIEIFHFISKSHHIPDNVLFDISQGVLVKLPQKVSVTPWDRDRIIKTTQESLNLFLDSLMHISNQKRRNGRLPDKVQETLTKFQTTPGCTPEMKRKIGTILRSDDANFYCNFPAAIDEICNFPPTNSEETKHITELLEFVHKQILIPERAVLLQTNHKYFEKLVIIVTNTRLSGTTTYTNDIRSKASAIVCDVLEHEKIPGLTVETLQLFCQTLKNLTQQCRTGLAMSNDALKDMTFLRSNLIKSVLKTFAKVGLAEIDISFDVLETLIQTITTETGLRYLEENIEALVMISLWNVSIKFENMVLPDAERLARKLLKRDAVDSNGVVHLEEVRNSTELEESNDHDVPEHSTVDLTYVSAMVGHILVRYFKSIVSGHTAILPKLATLRTLILTLKTHVDKTTRIYAAECFWVLSRIRERLPSDIISDLGQFAGEKELVHDVKVYCRVAFLKALEFTQVRDGKQGLFQQCPELYSYNGLKWLVEMYASNEKISIGNDGYSEHVNEPIIKILQTVSGYAKFPEEVYALLTLKLSKGYQDTTDSILDVLNIIENQIQLITSHSDQTIKNLPSIPIHCKQAIETSFVTCENPCIRGRFLNVLQQIVRDLGQLLEDDTLDELLSWLNTFREQDSETPEIPDYNACLMTLIYCHASQDLPPHVSSCVHAEFAASRLAACLQKHFKTKIPQRLKFLTLYNPSGGTEQTLTKTPAQLLNTLLQYVSQGKRMSSQSLKAIELSIKVLVETDKCLEGLILVSENGQRLAESLIKTAFNINSRNLKKDGHRSISWLQARLATTLVNNYQELEEMFVNRLVLEFCSDADYKATFRSDNNISKWRLEILTKLVQNNQLQKSLHAVVDKFCHCWNQNIEGTHQQRLNILKALVSFVNFSNDKTTKMFPKLKDIFMMTVQHDNRQIVETGLCGFIALNTVHGNQTCLPFCKEEDFQTMSRILLKNSTTPSVKKLVQDFFQTHGNYVPPFIREKLKLFNFNDQDDNEFITNFKHLLKDSHQNDLILNPLCQARMCTILHASTNAGHIVSLLEVLMNYNDLSKIPMTTFEYVAIALTRQIEGSVKSRKQIKVLCIKILSAGLRCSTVSPRLRSYINAAKSSLSSAPKNKEIQQQATGNEGMEKRIEYICSQGQAPDTHVLEECFQYIQTVIFHQESGNGTGDKSCTPRNEDLLRILTWKKNIEPDQCNSLLRYATRLYKNSSNSNRISVVILQIIEQLLFLLNETMETSFTEESTDDDDDVTQETISKRQIPKSVPYLTVRVLIEKFSEARTSSIERKLLMHILMLINSNSVILKEEQLGLVASRYDPSDTGNILKKLRDMQKQIGHYFVNLPFEILGEICTDNEELATEFHIHSRFVDLLVDFMLSLTYWDFSSVRNAVVVKYEWMKILHSSDFLSTFASCTSDELAFYECLLRIHDILPKEQSDDALETQAEFFVILNQSCMDLSKTDIPEFLTLLSQVRLSTALATMKHPQFLSDWKRNLQKDVLTTKISKHLAQSMDISICEAFIEELGAILSFDVTLAILGSLREKESIESFHSLLNLVEELHHDKDLFADKKFVSCLTKDLAESSKTLNEVISVIKTNFVLLALPPTIVRRDRLERIIRSLVNYGVFPKDIRELIELTRVTVAEGRGTKSYLHHTFEHIISQCYQYQVGKELFHEMLESLKSAKSLGNFRSIVDRNISTNIFAGNSGVKPLDQIIADFQLQNSCMEISDWQAFEEQFSSPGHQWDILKQKILLVKDCKKESIVCGNEAEHVDGESSRNLICDWDAQQVKAWANKVQNSVGKYFKSKDEFFQEALMVAKRAMKLIRNFSLTDIQILSCIMALQKLDKNKGLLQQVVTGSGKSAIIAVLAAMNALYYRRRVDVYTSSPVLAERDAQEWSTFYQLFKLTCSHNADKGNYISGPKYCYKHDIVYGECSQFQFDFLRDKYKDLNTLSGRSYDYAIIDEVDNMLLDNGTKLARLSSSLSGADLLEIMYHFIWDRLEYLQEHLFSIGNSQIYFLEGHIKKHDDSRTWAYDFLDQETNTLCSIPDIFAYIVKGDNLEKAFIQLISVPILEFLQNHLTLYAYELVGQRAPESGTVSDENQQNDRDKSSGCKIKLPQFLVDFVGTQIPKWVDSAMTALVYQENVDYVIENDEIKPVDYMTTGIIQNNTNWSNGLHQFLGLKHSLKIQPETITSNFISNSAMIKMYGSNILGFTGTLGSRAGRSVMNQIFNVNNLYIPEQYYKLYQQFPDMLLSNEEDWLQEIVTSTLQETSNSRAVLIICETILKAHSVSNAFSKFPVKVKTYIRNGDDRGNERQIERVHPGDVIIATNLAGRGTDIKTTQIEQAGGLHVVLTFLPSSERIDEQAFGRTSRQDNRGTGQLIIIQPDECLTSDFRRIRDERESKLLKNFEGFVYPKIKLHDEMFYKFTRLYGDLRDMFRLEMKESFDGHLLTAAAHRLYSTISGSKTSLSTFYSKVLQSVEMRWALFLRGIDDQTESFTGAAHAAYENFQKNIKEELGSGTLYLLKAAKNPFYFTEIGNSEYSRDHPENANKYYDLALAIDQMDFSAGSLVGKGCCLLKQAGGTWNREKALDLLHSALPLLYREMSMITVKQTLVKRSFKNTDTNTNIFETQLMQQLTEKANLLGKFINHIQMNIDTAERSLRRVRCTGVKLENGREISRESCFIPTYVIECDRSSISQDFDEYNLAFHDLTVSYDMGTKDQAILTLSGFEGYGVTFVCPNGDINDLINGKQETSKEDRNLLSKPMQLDVEISGFEYEVRLESDEKGSPKEVNVISFPFEKVKADIKSISVEVEMPQDKVIKASKAPNTSALWTILKALPNVTVEVNSETAPKGFEEVVRSDKQQHYCRVLSIDEGQRKSALSRQVSLPIPEQQNRLFTSLKFGKLVNSDELESVLSALCLTLKEDEIDKPFVLDITLTLHGIDKNKEKLLETYNEALCLYTKRTTLYIKTRSAEVAVDIIPWMRDINLRFTMQVNKLSLSTAQRMLKKASLEKEDMQQSKLQDFTHLYMWQTTPVLEIQLLSARGISILVTFNEKHSMPYKSLLCLCAIAAVQVAAGLALIMTAYGVSAGHSLMTEGISDFATVYRSASSRQFSWGDYGKQKAVSILITGVSVGTFGIMDSIRGVKTTATSATFRGKLATTCLRKQAFKLLGVGVGETVARVTLKEITSRLTSFSFRHLQHYIAKDVGLQVQTELNSNEFNHLLSIHWALENFHKTENSWDMTGVQQKVEALLQKTLSPSENWWMSQWNSVGSPLITGIFSDPKFLGSGFNTATLVWGAVSGVSEMHAVVGKVIGSILKGLRDHTLIHHQAVRSVQNLAELSMKATEYLKSKLEFNIQPGTGDMFSVDLESEDSYTVLTTEDMSHVKILVERLNNLQNKFNSTLVKYDISRIIGGVVTALTSHIIRVADSCLVSPIMSQAGGLVVARVSEYIQNRWLVNNRESGNMTVLMETQMIAKHCVVEYEIDKLSRMVKEMKPGSSDKNEQTKYSNELKRTVTKLLKNAPASEVLLKIAAQVNGLKIHITTDPNAKPTQDQIDQGVNVLLFIPDRSGGGIGHYVLLDKNGGQTVIPTESVAGSNNCAFDIIGFLTGKSAEDIRHETAQFIVDNHTKYNQILERQKWIESRYPHEANEFMKVGGANGATVGQPSAVNSNRDKRAEIMRCLIDGQKEVDIGLKNIQNQAVERRKTGSSQPGWVYIVKCEGLETYYKVGMTNNPSRRLKELQKANNLGKFTYVTRIFTLDMHSTEKLAHCVLKDFRKILPKEQMHSGRTEMFIGDPIKFMYCVDGAAKWIQNLHEG